VDECRWEAATPHRNAHEPYFFFFLVAFFFAIESVTSFLFARRVTRTG
jgi:hypothetical protein